MKRIVLFLSVLPIAAGGALAIGACNTAELSLPPVTDGSGDYIPDARFDDGSSDASVDAADAAHDADAD